MLLCLASRPRVPINTADLPTRIIADDAPMRLAHGARSCVQPPLLTPDSCSLSVVSQLCSTHLDARARGSAGDVHVSQTQTQTQAQCSVSGSVSVLSVISSLLGSGTDGGGGGGEGGWALVVERDATRGWASCGRRGGVGPAAGGGQWTRACSCSVLRVTEREARTRAYAHALPF